MASSLHSSLQIAIRRVWGEYCDIVIFFIPRLQYIAIWNSLLLVASKIFFFFYNFFGFGSISNFSNPSIFIAICTTGLTLMLRMRKKKRLRDSRWIYIAIYDILLQYATYCCNILQYIVAIYIILQYIGIYWQYIAIY